MNFFVLLNTLADTNVYAHNLIDRFGSIAGVFNARYEELQTVDGIGPSSAALIKLVPQVYSMYALSARKGESLDSVSAMCRYFTAQFLGVSAEQIRLICLDDKMRVAKDFRISEGDGSSVRFDKRKIAEAAIISGCTACVLAHNHPLASCEPSKEDCEITECLKKLLRELGITLVEHIVVGQDGARAIISGGSL